MITITTKPAGLYEACKIAKQSKNPRYRAVRVADDMLYGTDRNSAVKIPGPQGVGPGFYNVVTCLKSRVELVKTDEGWDEDPETIFDPRKLLELDELTGSVGGIMYHLAVDCTIALDPVQRNLPDLETVQHGGNKRRLCHFT